METTNFYGICLDQYDGPMDLLLHLVKKDELPIEKLSLAKVADQYFSCLEKLAELDFDLAGEYLVIAATLLSIKSLYLTGGNRDEIAVESEDLELDPHEELLRRLKEAAIYRQGAEALSKVNLLGIDVFQSHPTKSSAVSEIVLKDHDPFSLGKALQKIIGRAKERGQEIKITVDAVNIADRMVKILSSLRSLAQVKPNQKINFENLLSDDFSVSAIVASFLAVLELCKRNIVAVEQDQWCEGISVWLTESLTGEETLDFSDVDSDLVEAVVA